MLLRIQGLLHTSDHQFSFKAKHSTDMCIFTLKSIIDYYITSSSPVYICYLDASKAFDRINYWCLFDKLIKRNVPHTFVCFLIWYCTQEFCVRWGNIFSKTFTVTNGVRQGGIMSPLLFNVYMDYLSKIFNSVNAGCMLNGVNFNHLLYADDMTLIEPSIRALQILLKYCDKFACENDVLYNTKKTKCMCIKPKVFKSKFEPSFILSGEQLDCVECHKNLGMHVAPDLNDDTDIRYQCRNIYSRGNTLIRNFKECNESVKCRLFQSYCTQFYGAALWSCYNDETMRLLKVAYNRIFRILLGLEHRCSMTTNFISRGLNPFPVVIRKLIYSFRNRIYCSDKKCSKNNCRQFLF